MANQVKFSDLFEGFDEGIAGLEKQISGVQTTLTNMLGEVKKKAEEMYGALQGVSSATKTDRDATSAYASEVERLHKDFEKLTQAIGLTNTQLENMANKKPKDKKPVIDLAKSYESLNDLIQQTGISLEELLVTDKQKAIADKNGKIAVDALAGSYNQLYAQYNLAKNVLNAMGAEMRNNENIGKVWEARALSMMDTMKKMQEATGKHTLSVGEYGKAVNGLHLSFNQITRELPSLTNSASQFAIAISNNIPLFTDAIHRYSQEHKAAKLAFDELIASGKTEAEAIKALGESANYLQGAFKATLGVFKTFAGWIGIISAVIPLVTKLIEKKRKAQTEDNEVMKASVEIAKKLSKVYQDIAKSASGEAAKLTTLYRISQDTNRSMEERIAVGKELKKQYADAFEDFTAEEIALGKAKRAYDELTKSVIEHAKAVAYLDKIIDLEKDAIDQRELVRQTRLVKDQTKAEQDRLQVLHDSNIEYDDMGNATSDYIQDLVNAKKSAQDANGAWIEADSALQKIENTIARLRDEIPALGLNTENLGGTTKDTTNKMKDYYWEYAESVARIIQDELTREVELSDISYNKKIEGLKNELATNKELTVANQEYINGIILNLEVEKEKKRLDVVKEWTSKRLEELSSVYEEEALKEDDSISGRYERLLADQSQKILASRVKLNDALESNSYREAKKEGKIFKDLTIEKLKLEADFQRELLKMRLDTGELTQDQYDIELAGIEDKLAKSIAGLNKRGRKQKFSIWNLVFGETKEDGKGNVFKELDEEAKAFVDAFTSSMQMAFDYMDEWMDKRIEMAEIAVEAAEKESEAAKTALDYEMEARANGYANNVELARKEYEEKLKLEQDAIAEKERLQKIQEGIDTATQLSSLITATAQLWASLSGVPLGLGVPLAIAATALMFGSFAAAKITAAQMTATKYGEGMSEYIDYGGSHASGNDVDFGADKRGRRRRVERGEVIGVINKKNVDKYGVKTVTDVINSLNKGTFEDYISSKVTEKDIAKTNVANVMNSLIGESHYASVVNSLNRQSLAEIVAPEMNADLYHLAFAGLDREGVSLGGVESRLQTLIEQGETRVVPTADGRIEYRGNNKRIIHNS